MKIKLLRKVRRRFEINHLPKGLIIDKVHYDNNLFQLIDHKNGYFYNRYTQLGKKEDVNRFVDDIFYTETECINYLKSIIIKILRSEGHKQRKDKIIETTVKKVWHI